MARKGFYYDQTSCIGCRACQVACCDKNDLQPTMVFRVVSSYEAGEYPTARGYHYSASCNHCETPACTSVCPVEALYVDEEDGTVQYDAEKCIGCQYCVRACPYEVPQYFEDDQKVRKCDACKLLRAKDEQPACVAICPMRALAFGDIEELRAAYPDAVDQIVVLPDAAQTGPSVAIRAKEIALRPDPQEYVL
ncbi:MAG: 4Fe-4S dicluster domain-containing protein [Coriobacteriales bacterium]|jgi:anaerobic dimethyl sulfoxide reductase subunit B (iron-sulfur subunit)|nr:4Fe-4S dicluster domain-containing protein [Coriobacteriales bacterium]